MANAREQFRGAYLFAEQRISTRSTRTGNSSFSSLLLEKLVLAGFPALEQFLRCRYIGEPKMADVNKSAKNKIMADFDHGTTNRYTKSTATAYISDLVAEFSVRATIMNVYECQ